MSGEERFFVPTGGSALAAYRAFRAWAEGQAAARGRRLDPSWYRDGPEDLPELYDDRPSRQADRSAGGSAPQGIPPGPGWVPEAPGANVSGEDGAGG